MAASPHSVIISRRFRATVDGTRHRGQVGSSESTTTATKAGSRGTLKRRRSTRRTYRKQQAGHSESREDGVACGQRHIRVPVLKVPLWGTKGPPWGTVSSVEGTTLR